MTDAGVVVRLEPTDWMRAAASRALLAALAAAGGEARFVGGCVRNAVLGLAAADIDLATTLPPEAVLRAVERAGFRAVPTGLAHGTITAVVDHQPFEITTLRVDVETDGRRAVVAFTDDWQADAARRDFTMNALSADAEGRVWDYFGGVADARAGRVRFVGDPARRIAEDRLRLLRFFRFYAHYGRPPADTAALAACAAAAPELPALSGERIRAELLKLLAAPDPVPAWRLMAEHGVAEAAIGEAGDIERLAALVAVEPAPEPLRRLAALLTVEAAGAAALADRLRLSNAERERLATLVREAGAVAPDISPPALRQLLYRLGRERVEDLLYLSWASRPGAPRDPALLDTVQAWRPVALPVGGRDVVGLGVGPGPRVGALLRAVEEWWMDEDFAPDRAACLAELRRRAAEPDPTR